MAATNETKILVSLNEYKIHDKEALHGASVSGKTLTLTDGTGTKVVDFDASYANATTSAAGLMSAADKTLLDGLGTTGGQPNVIETVKLKTGTAAASALTVTDKTVIVDVSGKADKATSLSGYGITDAYTKTEVNTELDKKADSATTLAGYGITDAKIEGSKITLGTATITPVTDVSDKAPIASPALTGTPTAPTASKGTNTTQIATTAFVATALGDLAGAMVFKGVVNKAADLPSSGVKVGDTYRVGTAGTYAGSKCEVGDLIIATAATPTWTVAQNNVDMDGVALIPNTKTATHVVTFGSNNTLADSGLTIETSVPAGAVFTDTVYEHPTFTAKTSGLYKITVNGEGHVSAATAVAKTDITALGIPAQDTTYEEATTSKAGLLSADDKSKIDNMFVHPTGKSKTSGLYKITVDANGHVTAATAVAKADITGLGIPASDTTYEVFSASAAGLAPQAPASSAATKMLIGDGTWKALVLTVDADGNGTLGLQ